MTKLLLEGPKNPESCKGCALHCLGFTTEREFWYCVALYHDRDAANKECLPGPKCLEAQKAAELGQFRVEWAQHWLDEQCKQHGITVPAPHIAPYDSDNPTEVILEWWNDPKKLSIYLTFGGAWYIKISGPNIETDMVEGHVRSYFPELWAWLAENTP